MLKWFASQVPACATSPTGCPLCFMPLLRRLRVPLWGANRKTLNRGLETFILLPIGYQSTRLKQR